MENQDALSVSSANSGIKLVLKVVYNEHKLKLVIKEDSTTFKQLKDLILEKINKKIENVLTAQDIKITDTDNFEFDEQDLIFDLLNQNDQVNVIKKESQNTQQNTIPDQKPVSQNEEQKQQQLDLDAKLQEQQDKQDQTQIQEQVKQQENQTEAEEAIIVLYDVSGSMGCRFYGDKHLSRMGATNAFFSAFADKIIAFEQQNYLSLICFDSGIDQKCQFITDYQKFINLVDSANPGSATRLYDSIQLAIDQLLEIKKKYPKLILRILALTDGEDNQSKAQPRNLAQQIYSNGIIMDSFVVGSNCKGLKNITHASGGKCYAPKDINEGLQLFEIETIISAKSRGIDYISQQKQQNQEVNWEKIEAMDFDTDGIQMQKSSGANQAIVENPAELLKRVEEIYKKQEALQQQQMKSNGGKMQSKNSVPATGLGSANQKRILKEYNDLLQNPQTYVKYYPTADDITSWKVFMIGPPDSTYNQGVYQLSVKFPNDFPFKPPKIQFVTPIYHCNVSQQGSLCLDILKDQWSPALTIAKVFLSISTLMQSPNPDDALNSNIASEMRDVDTYHIYKKKALDYTLKYANPDINELLENVLGSNYDKTSQQYKEKQIEFEEWIKKCRKPIEN